LLMQRETPRNAQALQLCRLSLPKGEGRVRVGPATWSDPSSQSSPLSKGEADMLRAIPWSFANALHFRMIDRDG
jgi:hypothetical protein